VWLSNDSFSRPSCSIGSLLYPMVALVPSLLVEDNGSREAPPPLLAAGRLPRRTGASRGIAPDDRLRAQAARAGDRARDAVGRRLLRRHGQGDRPVRLGQAGPGAVPALP